MIKRLPSLVALLSAVALAGAGCEVPSQAKERWAATQNTNVKIDWDKVNAAYKAADGPADLERRVNEIYEGDEVISIAVQDVDDSTQIVTGFFDKNASGTVDEPEKIFTIQRGLTGEGTAQYQTMGYGPYHGYASPFFSIMSGMMLGSMMSSMFMPGYAPMYRQPYTTSVARSGDLRSHRSGYRAQHPDRFAKRSQTGKSYGGTNRSRSKPGRMTGGSRFGLRRAGRVVRPARLAA